MLLCILELTRHTSMVTVCTIPTENEWQKFRENGIY